MVFCLKLKKIYGFCCELGSKSDSEYLDCIYSIDSSFSTELNTLYVRKIL